MLLLVALKLEPANVGILWDCAALCYQMDNSKKALECYEKACQVMPLRSDIGLIIQGDSWEILW